MLYYLKKALYKRFKKSEAAQPASRTYKIVRVIYCLDEPSFLADA
jgi:hypothetical protein